MKSSICKFILNITGWQIVGNTEYPSKCVICVAPHTSNWDLIWGLIIYTSMGRRAGFLIKKDWFFFPMNLIFKALGGIPIDRSKNSSMTEYLADMFINSEKLQIAITPEGTRKKNSEWKKGFYYIALAAKVPIVITALDYKKKQADFKGLLIPSGDADKDIEIIKSHFKDVTPKHSEKFSL